MTANAPFAACGGTVTGVDGCKAGWVVAIARPDAAIRIEVFASFAQLVGALPGEAVIAVDMPIGLPERIGRDGRGPEACIRRHLGKRKSSVFSIPSRAAVYAVPGPFASPEEWYAAHRRASDVARCTSDPPRGISIQAFALFGRMREIDALLAEHAKLRGRVIESHPELAFWRLNGEQAMDLPKKIRGAVNPADMRERSALLVRHGIPRDLLDAGPPKGAGEDDLLDALAMLLVAHRHARGHTVPFPDPPLVDGRGIPVAIWA